MINYIKYRRKLSELEKGLNKNYSDFRNELKKAKSNEASKEEIDYINSEYRFNHSQYENEMRRLTCTYFLNKARKNLIPIPDHSSEMWEDGEYQKILTVDGINKIRTELRKNKKEAIETYMPFFTLLIGFIGALSGFFAVILK